MPDWFNLLLLTLACYRLSQLIAIDEGPLEIFFKLRDRLGAYDLRPDGQAKTNIGRGISCPYCVGMWFALLLAVVKVGLSVDVILWLLAIAGGQAFLWSLRNDN